jgi:nucleoside-diphosphate-sugar epimerase
MKIFVTGATGYVGSHLIPCLLKNQHEITCMLREPKKHEHLYPLNRCIIVEGDIIDRESIRNKMDHMDVVIHLAVATPLTNDSGNNGIYFKTNVTGTKNLLEECLQAKPKRIVCFSSTAAIGRPKSDFIDENTPLHPVNPYGKSKMEADKVISTYVEKYQLPVITICFPHIYGPGETHELFKVIKMIKNGILPQVGFRPNHLPLVFVSDAIDAILLAFTNGKPGGKYIIADDDPHDIRVIRKHVLEKLGIKRKYFPFVPKHIGIFGAYLLEKLFDLAGLKSPVKAENIRSIVAGRRLCINKAQNELGFVPKVGIQEGISKTLDWYQKEKLL